MVQLTRVQKAHYRFRNREDAPLCSVPTQVESARRGLDSYGRRWPTVTTTRMVQDTARCALSVIDLHSESVANARTGTVAEIQQAFFEYRANFKEPITIFWAGGRQAEIINAVQQALAPWHVDLENIAWQQGAKNLREVQLSFAVPSQLAFVQVGIAGVTMNALNPETGRVLPN